MSERYAFIGLGHLGGNLAASLIRNGFAVTVFDRDPAAVERLVALGATAADSPAEAAARAGNAISCLPSPKVSEAVLAGPGGLLEGSPKGGTWIEMSTNGRDEIVRLAALASAKGVETLNARSPAACIWRQREKSPLWSAAMPCFTNAIDLPSKRCAHAPS